MTLGEGGTAVELQAVSQQTVIRNEKDKHNLAYYLPSHFRYATRLQTRYSTVIKNETSQYLIRNLKCSVYMQMQNVPLGSRIGLSKIEMK